MSPFDPYNDLESIKDEWQRQHREEVTEKVIDAIIAVVFLVALVWLLWPKEVTASSWYTDIFGYQKMRDNKPVIEIVSYDDQKLLDKWKHYVKSEYNLKLLTLQDYIWQFLTDDMGLSDVCAAGIFGNMMVECGSRSFDLQPYIYSPGGAYYGLCQWSTSNHHARINGGSVEEQLEYLASTIREEMDEYGYSAFEGATDPETAADCFARWYERCSVPTGRREEARRAYERFTEG